MKQHSTDQQLWLSGKPSEITAALRRMMIRSGKDMTLQKMLQKRNNPA
ncbi:hypothetical protein [Paenibacillus sp. 1001270B_150601_E10]|nr:hypothetical protein [Paenibacillus sp. 1001270B_150601_E10]